MSKITVSALADEFYTFRDEQNAHNAQVIALLRDLKGASVTPAVEPEPKAPKAPTGKVFRSAKGKEQAKAACEKAWADAKAKAGVKRVKDLTPAQRAAVDAQVKAIWAAVPKTRTTKA